MGCGTYYTHPNGEKACWINFGEDVEQWEIDDTINELTRIILKHTSFCKVEDREFANDFYRLKLESKYYGEGLIFILEIKDEWTFTNPGLYALAKKNWQKAELKILRAIQKAGYKLHIATSGHTSQEITV